MKSRMISVSQFCKLVGIGRTKAYELINDRMVHSSKIGRRRLIHRESVDAFLATLLDEGGVL